MVTNSAFPPIEGTVTTTVLDLHSGSQHRTVVIVVLKQAYGLAAFPNFPWEKWERRWEKLETIWVRMPSMAQSLVKSAR